MTQMETPGLAPGGKGRFKNNSKADIQQPAPRCNAPETNDDLRRQFVLGWLRALHNRVSMFGTEIDYIGVSLKGGWVTPDDALDWLDELDPILLLLVGAREDGQ